MLLLTGASGALGSLIARKLSHHPHTRTGTRTPTPNQRKIDLDAPHTLDLSSVKTLLLISAGYGEDDTVIARHEAAIGAAERAGVRHIVYTSLTAEGDHLPYALAHRWTERRLRDSPLAWTVLRNGLYAELLAALAAPGPDGRITAPLGTGTVAAVAREDLADIAVRVALDPTPHTGRTYELVGDRAIGGADLAAATGTTYTPTTLAAARTALSGPGSVPFQIPMLIGTYSAIAADFLSTPDQGPLHTLLQNPPRDALKTYAAALSL